jgi:NAD+ synthase (glutamine-hydrolysing)
MLIDLPLFDYDYEHEKALALLPQRGAYGMKLTIAQLNPTVGDIGGNLAMLRSAYARAAGDGADLAVFPELFLVGYPPRDLLERADFIQRVQEAVGEAARLSADHPGTGLLFGAPTATGGGTGRGLYNAAILAYQGRILHCQPKSLLPTYDVFDEARYFEPAPRVEPVCFKGETLGISICEDAWNDPEFWPRGRLYGVDPLDALAKQGATIFVNISASPFYAGKDELRYGLIGNHARRHGLPFVYVNQVGANDELIFDGRSMVLDPQGNVRHISPAFADDVRTVDLAAAGDPALYVPLDRIESIHQALVLGVRDYLRKTGFTGAIVGLSGGIDSALTCCLAAEALGPGNVLGISMPSPYSSRGSVEDSRRLAQNLGVAFKVMPITSVYGAYLEALREHFAGREEDIAEENIQARIRGNILMALANKFGRLVLSTGNKSEMAVGYCTLYGDMSGGLSVLADVPKTTVYKLAAHINRGREIIPAETIAKAPSAELRPNQTDQDTLPPYPILDEILELYIEEGRSAEEIVARGFARETVAWVAGAVRRSEYKRHQAAPGLKVTSKAFGIGRRMPIAARW